MHWWVRNFSTLTGRLQFLQNYLMSLQHFMSSIKTFWVFQVFSFHCLVLFVTLHDALPPVPWLLQRTDYWRLFRPGAAIRSAAGNCQRSSNHSEEFVGQTLSAWFGANLASQVCWWFPLSSHSSHVHMSLAQYKMPDGRKRAIVSHYWSIRLYTGSKIPSFVQTDLQPQFCFQGRLEGDAAFAAHAARHSLLNLQPHNHVSAAFGELHWLPVT